MQPLASGPLPCTPPIKPYDMEFSISHASRTKKHFCRRNFCAFSTCQFAPSNSGKAMSQMPTSDTTVALSSRGDRCIHLSREKTQYCKNCSRRTSFACSRVSAKLSPHRRDDWLHEGFRSEEPEGGPHSPSNFSFQVLVSGRCAWNPTGVDEKHRDIRRTHRSLALSGPRSALDGFLFVHWSQLKLRHVFNA